LLVYASLKECVNQHNKRERRFIVTGKSYASLERRILRGNLCCRSEIRTLEPLVREQKSSDSTGMNTAEERKLLGILLEFRATTPVRR